MARTDRAQARRALHPTSIAAPFGRYSHGVEVEGVGSNLVVVSGQLGLSADGSIPDSVGGQAEICFENIDEILGEAGLSRSDVVHVRAFVTERSSMQGYMAARDAWLEGAVPLPASTLMIVAGFTRPEFKVEIEVLAVGEQDGRA